MDAKFTDTPALLSEHGPKAQWEEPCVEVEYSLVAQAQQPDDGDPLAFVGPLAVS